MTTGRSTGARRALAAAVLAGFVLGPGLAAPAAAQPAAGGTEGAIRGVLYQPDGKGKLGGGKVIAVNVRTGKQYTSDVTGDTGSYNVEGLPAGTYDLVIDVGGEVYVADNLVELAAGQKLALSYSVQPRRPANRTIKGLPEPRGSASVIGVFKGTGMPAATDRTPLPPFWSSPGGIILLSVLGAGAAYAIYDAIDDDEEASPSGP